MMNPTIELLQLLGSPFAPTTAKVMKQSELAKLYDYSEKNRMLFHFLEKARMLDSNNLSAAYERENIRRSKIDHSISKASSILEEAHIEHAVFKTIRPYESTTVDIDVIVFRGYANAIRIMQEAGYRLVVRGPLSTTMWDSEASIGIDLYDQVAVSSITYIDKLKLIDSITDTKLPNGGHAKTLMPEADLACIIAHSIIKEQMYTLAEYYTFIHYLKRMDIDEFTQIVKKNNIRYQAKVHATITAMFHQTAHGIVPEPLQQILSITGQEKFETARLQKRGLEAPHKYHLITIGRSLLEITRGRETRRNLTSQLSNMFDANFSVDFLRKLIDHVSRETY